MGDRSDSWDDLEAWEAELQEKDALPLRRRRGIVLAIVIAVVIVIVWIIWVVALFNPDNWRLPVTPTPPVTPWEQGGG